MRRVALLLCVVSLVGGGCRRRAKVAPEKPLRYRAGAGWSKAGEFTTAEAWNAYVSAQAARLNSPVKVSVSK